MGWTAGTFTRTNGVYTGPNVWQDDEANGFDIEASRADTHDEDLAQGINSCINKDGSNSMTGDLPLNSNKIVSLASGTAATDAVNKGQLDAVNALVTALTTVDAGTTSGQTLVWNDADSSYEPTDAIQVNSGAPWIGVNSIDEGIRVASLVDDFIGLYAGANGDTAGTTTASLSINGTTTSVNATTGPLNLQAGGNTYLRINSDGKVVVNGASAVGARCVVQADSGDGVIFRAFDSSGDVVFDAYEDGRCRMPELGTGSGTPLEISGGVIVRDTSSQRFKEKIEDYTDALSDFMKLRPRTYRRKDNGELEAGFIAEEVHASGLTKYVAYEDGQPISVHYGKITALLAAAVQELFKDRETD